MSNVRLVMPNTLINEALPGRFCEGYTTEVARTSEGRVISVIERACLKSAAPVAEILIENDGSTASVFFCRAHHSAYREVSCD